MNIKEIAKKAYVQDCQETCPGWYETEFTDYFLDDLQSFLELFAKMVLEAKDLESKE